MLLIRRPFNINLVKAYGPINLNFLSFFFFFENNTPWASLLGSGLKSIFQLKAHFEINERSLFRVMVLSFLSPTIVKRDVLSAKSLGLVFNSLGKSLM